MKWWSTAALAAWLLAACLTPTSRAADAASSPADLVAEARHSFTLDGKQNPPEIFRDFGDGDLADSGAIWVTIDLKAAIGSYLYFDDITKNGDWVIQKKVRPPPDANEESAYTYIGETENGLLVALTTYSGGGTGEFITLHILDLASGRGFGADGDLYDRINLTNLRSVPLGDRWDGEVTIAKNMVTIVTTRAGPPTKAGRGKRRSSKRGGPSRACAIFEIPARGELAYTGNRWIGRHAAPFDIDPSGRRANRAIA